MKSIHWFYAVIVLMIAGLIFFIRDWIIPVSGFLIGVVLYVSTKIENSKLKGSEIGWVLTGALLIFYFAMGYGFLNGDPIEDPGLLAMLSVIGSSILISIMLIKRLSPLVHAGTVIISGGILFFSMTVREDFAPWVIPTLTAGTLVLAILSTHQRYLLRMLASLWISGTTILATFILADIRPLIGVFESFISGENIALDFIIASSAGFLTMYLMPLYILGLSSILLGIKKLSKQPLQSFDRTVEEVIMRQDKENQAKWLRAGVALVAILSIFIIDTFTSLPPLLNLSTVLMIYGLITNLLHQQE